MLNLIRPAASLFVGLTLKQADGVLDFVSLSGPAEAILKAVSRLYETNTPPHKFEAIHMCGSMSLR